MSPRVTASRSAAPMVPETPVVPLPARSPCSEEASPPPAGTGTRDPSGPSRKVRGPRFETTMVPLTAPSRPARQRGRGDPLERSPEDVDGLGAQLVQGPVAVDALAEVDLGQAVRPQALCHVDQEAQLDP